MNSYFELPGVSQSLLKQLDSSPVLAKKMIDEEKKNRKGRSKAFDFGSAVDLLITQPEVDLSEEFYTVTVERPSSKLHELLIYIEENNLPYSKASITEAVNKVGFGAANWKADTIKEKLKPLISYVEDLEKAGDKAIITPSQKKMAEATVTSIQLDVFASELLYNPDSNYQKVLQTELYGISCKGMMDNLIIDEAKKEITIVDLKTMEGFTTAFLYSFFKFRYDIQSAFYLDLVTQLYPGYEIKGFYFVVASSTGQGRPLVYKATAEIIRLGRFGGKLSGKKLNGYVKLLEIYQERLLKNEWTLPIGYLETGYTTINTDNITF